MITEIRNSSLSRVKIYDVKFENHLEDHLTVTRPLAVWATARHGVTPNLTFFCCNDMFGDLAS